MLICSLGESFTVETEAAVSSETAEIPSISEELEQFAAENSLFPRSRNCGIMLTQKDIVSTSDSICAEAHVNMV